LDEEFEDLIASADVVVLPYIEASQSGVIPIAIHHNRFIVCSSAGALREQVRGYKNSTVYDCFSTEALIGALKLSFGQVDNEESLFAQSESHLSENVTVASIVLDSHSDIL
jgi:hypothetical protein